MVQATAGPESDIRAVQQLLTDWWSAVNAGEAERLLKLSSDQLEIISPGEEPAAGAAAHEALRALLDEYVVELAPFTGEEIVASGDLAYQRYTYEWTLISKAGGDTIRERGHGIHILRRQRDGSWRVVKDIYSSISAG